MFTDFFKKSWYACFRAEDNRSFFNVETKEVCVDQNTVFYLTTINDITYYQNALDKVELEKRKVDRQNEARSQFILGISHDIRTPFHSVKGFVDLLIEQESDDKKLDMLNYVSSSTDRLIEFIDHLVDAAYLGCNAKGMSEKADNVRFSPRDVISQITSLVAPDASSKGLDLMCQVDDNVPKKILGNKFYLQRSLLNLLNNALKITLKGSVVVKVYWQSPHSDQSSQLVVKVIDTGVGISCDQHDVIFERFSRLHSKSIGRTDGMGLGLPMVKKMIEEELGGKVLISSAVGVGTTMTCFFPCKEIVHESRMVATVGSYKRYSEISKMKILLVDDEVICRKFTEMSIRPVIKHLDVVENASQAYFMASLFDYDLILMDIGLPDMDGFQAADRIRSLPNHCSTVILALTAYIDQKEPLSKSIFDKILFKPISKDELLNQLSVLSE